MCFDYHFHCFTSAFRRIKLQVVAELPAGCSAGSSGSSTCAQASGDHGRAGLKQSHSLHGSVAQTNKYVPPFNDGGWWTMINQELDNDKQWLQFEMGNKQIGHCNASALSHFATKTEQCWAPWRLGTHWLRHLWVWPTRSYMFLPSEFGYVFRSDGRWKEMIRAWNLGKDEN